MRLAVSVIMRGKARDSADFVLYEPEQIKEFLGWYAEICASALDAPFERTFPDSQHGEVTLSGVVGDIRDIDQQLLPGEEAS